MKIHRKKIASVFIEDVLKKVLDRTHEDKIHTIFVGAPGNME